MRIAELILNSEQEWVLISTQNVGKKLFIHDPSPMNNTGLT